MFNYLHMYIYVSKNGYFVKSKIFFHLFSFISSWYWAYFRVIYIFFNLGVCVCCMHFFFYTPRFFMIKFRKGCYSCMLNCLRCVVRCIPGKKVEVYGVMYTCLLFALEANSTYNTHLLVFGLCGVALNYTFILYVYFIFFSFPPYWNCFGG